MMVCPICGEEIKTLVGLKLHIQRMHLRSNVCPICGKEARNLLTHLGRKSDKKHRELWAIMTKVRSYLTENGKEEIRKIRNFLEKEK